MAFWDFRRLLMVAGLSIPWSVLGATGKEKHKESVVDASTIKLKFGRFGDVTIYNSDVKAPTGLFVFLSGDGGWNSGVVDMAKSIAAKDAIVVGVSVPSYMKALKTTKGKCYYPAGDLESLSHFVQKKLDLKSYVKPVLVGYSSGATLAYATVAQAPEGSYDGAITLGFCPDLIVDRPFCRGGGLESVKHVGGKGIDFLPKDITPSRWTILNGVNDKVCKVEEQRTFIAKIPTAKLVELQKVGHGFGNPKNWLPQLMEAANEFKKAPTPPIETDHSIDLGDLPLIETEVAGAPGKYFAMILSGDGGWAGLDRALSLQLRDDGIKSVGLDSLKYFWQEKSPEILTKDLTKIAEYYSKKWHISKIVWIGYSFGADVLPFALSRLQGSTKDMTAAAVYLGPSKNATFEFHISDWLDASSDGGENVPKEIMKLASTVPQICIYGDEEHDSPCSSIKGNKFVAKPLSGGHHFGGDYDALAKIIEEFAAK